MNLKDWKESLTLEKQALMQDYEDLKRVKYELEERIRVLIDVLAKMEDKEEALMLKEEFLGKLESELSLVDEGLEKVEVSTSIKRANVIQRVLDHLEQHETSKI